MIERIIIIDSADPVSFYGVNNSNMQLIRNLFPKLRVAARGSVIKVIGEDSETAVFERKIKELEEYAVHHNALTEDVILDIVKGDAPKELKRDDVIIYGINGKPISGRTPNQQRLVEEFTRNDLTFALGPAGTGKTYVAIALAVRALKNREVRKIILSRPAVEAGEKLGFLPNAKFYDKFYTEGHWSGNTIISVSIGQGEVLATPLQIANLCATIANRGWFITPHVVKEIQDTVMPGELLERRRPTIDEHWYADVAEGMRMAVTGGTCRRAALRDIEVAGKTGTAQNPHGKDHSAFMGFAPYTEPKIAVAAYVENAGFGATFGVPIGSLVMEKYLTGTIAPERKYMEEQMLNTSLYYAPARKK